MGSVSECSINCLPDDLLVQILSFLPTKQAASTSLLSKRWRTLFAFAHNLDFDNYIFWHPRYGLEHWVDIQKRFDDFVDRILSLQDVNKIKKFSLTLSRTYEDEHDHDFDHWICYALEHGVSELHLDFVCYVEEEAHITPTLWKFAIPSKVFTSTTLVKLSLGTSFLSEYCPRLPSDISLPALKVLLLHSIGFEGNQLSDVFLAACPSLEDLTIEDYDSHPKFSYVISSKTIKKLSVTYYNCGYNADFSTIISFDTPNVVDFYYSDYLRHESPNCHLDSLSKATLDLRLWGQVQNGADVTDLIHGIRNVRTLHLTISAVELISVFCKSRLPVFNNLVDLVLTSKKEGWEVLLPLLLERSPNLKTLVLSDLDSSTGRRHQFTRIPPNNQIKMLRIMKYKGYASDLKRLRHFLLKMECLEVVQVYVVAAMDDPKKMQLTEDILKLPAASSKVKIQVV